MNYNYFGVYGKFDKIFFIPLFKNYYYIKTNLFSPCNNITLFYIIIY